MSLEEFRQQLVEYLLVEKKLIEADIEKQKLMTTKEKVEKNLLLVDVKIASREESTYVLDVPNNYSKLRTGDKVTIEDEAISLKAEATIIDVFFDSITISCEKELDENGTYTIEQVTPVLLQSLIACIDGLYAGVPGLSFMRLLSGEERFEVDDFLKVDIDDVPSFGPIREKMDDEKLSAVESMLTFPPVHILQGPPGTGKTLVLAATAIATSRMNREVVIIANTHHAVNNALLKIRELDKKASVIKIGPALKAEELDSSIINFEKFGDYYDYSYKNRKKKRTGHIIGMTIWGAVTYLGLRHHAHFRPYQALVDEASLMPLTLGAILGKAAPSVCLFGDSRQMPPIFQPELEENPFSLSILDYCAKNVDGAPVSVLPTTYRMNGEITDYVSRNFYEPYGVKLHSSDFSKNRILNLPCFKSLDTQGSIVHVVKSYEEKYTDYNPEEAKQVITLAQTMLSEGLQAKDIAIITPFRKQVRALREAATELLGDAALILIDTVERLQGQDVDCILISFAASDEEWIKSMCSFIFNPNRMNVMISRAKKKVIFFESEAIQKIALSVRRVGEN